MQTSSANGGPHRDDSLLSEIRAYWDQHIHDQEITTAPIGSPAFFRELEAYRFEKLDYLPELLDSIGCKDQKLLEVGCGAGVDLAHLAGTGAVVTGIDLAPSAIELARRHLADRGLAADLHVMNGEEMAFPDASFDRVYVHSVLQYTADPKRMVAECRRVLRPDGEAVFMVYNRISWLNALSKVMKVPLEHEDAPVLEKYSIAEYRTLLDAFSEIRIVPERFPVRSKLHGGWKGFVYNHFFVDPFNWLPRSRVRRFGWHLMAFCRP